MSKCYKNVKVLWKCQSAVKNYGGSKPFKTIKTVSPIIIEEIGENIFHILLLYAGFVAEKFLSAILKFEHSSICYWTASPSYRITT